ncbi:MAG: bifunctional phosphoribosylaminoimidazolecarboxamide formyltransferase/IMP cyclohydrolase [Thermoplasmata archaeon]|nr:bifunctional phosphoribosylaminoimidazolecarboxamide formyltransferase/IMP cyclohydrolase [Thermoplasmata archaeon]
MRAIVSVSDRRNINVLVKELIDMNAEIYATSGTLNYLITNNLKVKSIEELTNFPEILSGRVKTLHPNVFGGILARSDQLKEIEKLKIKKIDLVVVNLYPFEQTDKIEEKLIENIDIGGVSLIRAAAKNFESVAVVTDPDDYSIIIENLKEKNEIPIEIRKELALKAFYYTARYDSIIYRTLWELYKNLPYGNIIFHGKGAEDLRYGENPQNIAKFYSDSKPWEYIQGKEISYNNILDMDSAWKTVFEFENPAVAIIKHTNPCGVAESENLVEAYKKALESDPMSAYGGIVAVNRKVDIDLARELKGNFYELLAAPDFSVEAIEFFKKNKKNMRVIKIRNIQDNYEIRTAAGGFLYQKFGKEEIKFNTVTKKEPTLDEMNDLKFAWKVVKHVKSNAIVLAKNHATVGIGAGQMSRVDSVKISIMKSNGKSVGSVLASDAFFPFPDDVEEAAKGGIKAIIQPGGSKRDQEVIDMANRYGIAMVFTGVRVFRH